MITKGCREILSEIADLCVVECARCGFHLGVDTTYLRCHAIVTSCPACKHELTIEEIE
jgi:hypothetical protein